MICRNMNKFRSVLSIAVRTFDWGRGQGRGVRANLARNRNRSGECRALGERAGNRCDNSSGSKSHRFATTQKLNTVEKDLGLGTLQLPLLGPRRWQRFGLMLVLLWFGEGSGPRGPCQVGTQAEALPRVLPPRRTCWGTVSNARMDRKVVVFARRKS